MKVGDKILMWDGRRIIARNEKGQFTGGNIIGPHWREMEIMGETETNWILRLGIEVNKRDLAEGKLKFFKER